MSVFLYLILINVLIRIGTRGARKLRKPKTESVCATCVFAHIQYAVGGKRAVSCTLGGVVRPITIDVMYCTDYRDRCAREPVTIFGFGQALHDTAAEEVA